MKALKIIALAFAGLLIVAAIGAYVFFKKSFTPDPNYLELTEASGHIPIQWTKSPYSDIAGLLLPVKIKGIPHTFYMQFDTGAPSTLLYDKTLLTIQKQFPNQILGLDSTSNTTAQTLQVGDLTIHSKQFKLYDRGVDSIDWNDSTIIRIGTLGADIIDKKLTVFDFKNHCIYFGDEAPDLGKKLVFHPLKYKMRKVMLPATIAGKKRKLLHDSGTSGFELITNKKNWDKLSKKSAHPEEAFKVKSWKRQLTAYNIASDKEIVFKPLAISLDQVTYIKGASAMQKIGMRLTGMGGMIGNQLFMNKVLVLDCKNRRYAILD